MIGSAASTANGLLFGDGERVGALRCLVEPGADVELDVERSSVRLVELAQHLELVRERIGQRSGLTRRLVRATEEAQCRVARDCVRIVRRDDHDLH